MDRYTGPDAISAESVYDAGYEDGAKAIQSKLEDALAHAGDYAATIDTLQRENVQLKEDKASFVKMANERLSDKTRLQRENDKLLNVIHNLNVALSEGMDNPYQPSYIQALLTKEKN